MVEGDFLKLNRVVTNLIDNAVAHSPSGAVVSVSVDQDDDHVVLTIEDQGTGVDPEDRTLIFERFVRRSSERPGPASVSISSRASSKPTADRSVSRGTKVPFIVKLPRLAGFS